MSKTILFIDSKVTDYQTLLTGLGSDVEVHILNPEEDGVLQMAAILKSRTDLNSIQVISHGTSGSLYLGSSVLNNNNLSLYQNALNQIGSSLSATGDILLYGCNVAQGESGLQFINNLSQLTGADVAASDDLTGNTFAGANWNLEKTTGAIEASALLQSDVAGFGNNILNPLGSIITNFDETNLYDEYAEIRSVVVQSDGKILVAGGYNYNSPDGDADFAVARYNSNGSLDTSFAGDGKLITNIREIYDSVDEAYSLAIQAGGKILVAGVSKYSSNAKEFALVRYNTDGSLDTTFDTVEDDGIVTTNIGGIESIGRDVLIQPDGKILVAGQTYLGSGYNWTDFALVRYNSNGSLDSSFDSDGIATTDLLHTESGYSVGLQSSGKILVAGIMEDTYKNFALLRYNTDGSLDTNFANDGVAITAVISNSNNVCNSMIVQHDNKVLLAGYTFNTTNQNYDFALVRYNSDGSLDSGFSGDGIAKTNFVSGKDDQGYSVALQADGKILVAGTNVIGDSGFWDIALARYNPDGSLDTSFDGDGRVTTNLGYDYNSAYSVTVQDDGKILVAGTVSNLTGFSNGGFALVRYNSNGSLDTTFDGKSNNPPSGTVTISDTTPTQKQLLTATNTLADIDGLGTISYQWKANNIAITGATKSTFTPTQAQVGKTITVTASYTDGHNNAESVTSSPTSAVANVNDLPIGSVTISGLAKQGEKLTASNNLADLDGLGTITYQWKAGGVVINGATASSYYVTHADIGKTITVTASYTDGFGINENKTSQATTAVEKNYTDLVIYGDQGGSKPDVLDGASGNDEIHGKDYNDVLWGYEGNDTLFGDAGSDQLYAGDGNDTLTGGIDDLAADTLIGGNGSDIYFVGYGSSGLVNDIVNDQGTDGAIDKVFIPFQVTSYTLASGIENGTISTGTQASNLTGNAGNNTLTGNAGDNILNGGLGNDSLYPASGNDTVNGGDGNDAIIGGDGRGDDFYTGGGGIDTVKYTSATLGIIVNLVTGKASGNEIGNDTLNTIENIIAGKANDTLIGNGGNNVLNGFTGEDKMAGGLGNDVYVIDNIRDVVTETSTLTTEIDQVNSSVSYVLTANVENLTLTGTTLINGTGNALKNTVLGNAVANILNGGLGNDTLNGGAGNDRLIGGAGKDILIGGLGADKFQFNNVADTGISTTRDSVADFKTAQGDKIDLSLIDADTVAAGNNAFKSLTVGGVFSGAFANRGDLYFDQTNHILYGNNDTDSAPDFSMLLTGVTTLTTTAFIL